MVSTASLTFRNSNGSTENVNGEVLEYFYDDLTYQAFIVVRSLPLIANPVIVYESDEYNGFGTFTDRLELTGQLYQAGSRTLVGVEATLHGLIGESYSQSGEVETTPFLQLILR